MSEDLFRAAKAACGKAYAPYSKLHVGAAIRTASGKIFTGANMENLSYPEGWCAETTALGAMLMAAETPEDRRVVEVAVAADLPTPITPCGGCRQRLSEFAAPDAPVHGCDLTGIRATRAMAALLPAAFDWDGPPEG